MKSFATTESKFTVDSNNYPMSELTFLGLSAIMDPPRDDTAKAIRECKAAGIKVFMVTGWLFMISLWLLLVDIFR